MAQTLINHQGHSFIPIRSDYWAICSEAGASKTVTAAMCKVMAVLENWSGFVQDLRRDDWVKMSIAKFTEQIREHGVNTIRQAIANLAQLGLIEKDLRKPQARQGDWENPAPTWWYRVAVNKVQSLIDALKSQKNNRSIPVDQPPDPSESTDSSEQIEIIDSLLEPSSEPPKQNNVSATVDFFEEEVNQEELKALEIEPEEVQECINRNSFNYHWALWQLKKFIFNGNCKNPTGYLMSRLSCRQDKSSAVPAFSRECPKPSDRTLQELAEKYGSDNVGQTVLDLPEMGYPFAWVVVIGEEYRPWWEVV